ncbi:MAG TPA: hypothetical protein VHU84_16620 [Lacipirellulaceae bacterium]|jgi:competence protein ComEC|nr:hypothetical protein [Lacipirellulaceae bacterium]
MVNKIGLDNANSVTVAVEYAGRRVLLPGDLESPGLDDLIAEDPYDCDILQAPHHGSRRNEPANFAAWSTPDWVVISAGANDEVRTATAMYEGIGARVLATNEVGLVRFGIGSDHGLRLTTWREPGLHGTTTAKRVNN